MPIEALAPVVVVLVGFVGYCLWDITRAARVRHLPKWAWALLIVASVPLGGIAYLVIGRDQS